MRKNDSRGLFITLEGGEGVGKSTMMMFIKSYLSERNISFVATREPGGTPIGEEIRKILLMKHDRKISADTELLLMFAARAQHIKQVIEPALADGRWVISDRFTDASYAYQGAGRGIFEARIAVLEQWLQPILEPDLTLLLDAPIDVGATRMMSRERDRIEQESTDFFCRVRAGYLARAKRYPERFRIINAAVDTDQVRQQIEDVLYQLQLS